MQISASNIVVVLTLLFNLAGVDCLQLAQTGHEGVNHGHRVRNVIERRTTYPPANLACPSGCALTTYPVKGANAGVFWSTNVDKPKVDTAFVVVHGQWRDGGNYWGMMDYTLKAVMKANNYTGVPKSAVIVAPEYFSKTNDLGLYGANTLAWSWGDWTGGGSATNPKKTTITAFDVLDALLDEFSNFSQYPSMKRIVFIGHGGGGQLMQRYAVMGKQSRIPARYIIGNPSSSLYFTSDRPTVSGVSKSSCPSYNAYRYGLTGYNGGLSAQQLFRQYIGRDVVNIVGLQDLSAGGDQTCNATMQGGDKRVDRNLIYWRYINLLAGTKTDVSGFPGVFPDGLPDWSSISGGQLQHKLVAIERGWHNLDRLLASQAGQSAIFSLDSSTIQPGWRPAPNPNNPNNATLRHRDVDGNVSPDEEAPVVKLPTKMVTTRLRKASSTLSPSASSNAAQGITDDSDDDEPHHGGGTDSHSISRPAWCFWC